MTAFAQPGITGEDDVRQYLNEIRQFPRLTPEQERELTACSGTWPRLLGWQYLSRCLPIRLPAELPQVQQKPLRR